jgi:hypothetical protein
VDQLELYPDWIHVRQIQASNDSYSAVIPLPRYIRNNQLTGTIPEWPTLSFLSGVYVLRSSWLRSVINISTRNFDNNSLSGSLPLWANLPISYA